jgi:hypothetical protein
VKRLSKSVLYGPKLKGRQRRPAQAHLARQGVAAWTKFQIFSSPDATDSHSGAPTSNGERLIQFNIQGE